MRFVKVDDIIKLMKNIKDIKEDLRSPSAIFGYGLEMPNLVYNGQHMKLIEAFCILYTVLNYTENLRLEEISYRGKKYLSLTYRYRGCDDEYYEKYLVWWQEGREELQKEGLGGIIRLCKMYLILSTFLPPEEAYKCALYNKITDAPLMIMDYPRAAKGMFDLLWEINGNNLEKTTMNTLDEMSFEIKIPETIPSVTTDVNSEIKNNDTTTRSIKKTYLIVRDGLNGNNLTHPPTQVFFSKEEAEKELKKLASGNPGCVFRLYESMKSLSCSVITNEYKAK